MKGINQINHHGKRRNSNPTFGERTGRWLIINCRQIHPWSRDESACTGTHSPVYDTRCCAHNIVANCWPKYGAIMTTIPYQPLLDCFVRGKRPLKSKRQRTNSGVRERQHKDGNIIIWQSTKLRGRIISY